MKKYLTLAIALGAIAFVSVSYLANAEPQAESVVTSPAAPADALTPVAPTVDTSTFATDSDACNTMVAATPAEGKEEAFKKCMMDKGHAEGAIENAPVAPETMPATE